MFIENARDTIQNCRFCLMCRHACTVAKFTKNESDTPRAKALNLWTVLEGMRSFTMNDAEIFFNCVDCHRCKEHCISDYDVPAMVEATRRDLVKAGLVPDEVKKIRDDILEKGNPFGVQKIKAEAPRQSDLLLFPGCEISYNSPEILETASRLMNAMGLSFEVLQDECCGAPLKSLGFYEDAKLIGDRLVSKILETKAREIIVLCPTCFISLMENFRDLGISLPEGLHIKMFFNFLAEAINNGKLKLKSGPERKIVIHDPCSTGRKLQLYELPRKILKDLPGIELAEFFLNKGESPCCGGSVISRRVSPEMGSHSAATILNEAKELEIDGIVTACPSCRFHFNQQELQIKTFDILELLTF